MDKTHGATPKQRSESKAAKRTRNPDAHVASALRSAYEETVQEDVPAEFLDLLNKLS